MKSSVPESAQWTSWKTRTTVPARAQGLEERPPRPEELRPTMPPPPATPSSWSIAFSTQARFGLPGMTSSTACPEGMLLVDGEYCTDVETKCLRSSYAKQNKKTICHEFQSPSVGVGKKEHRRYCIDTYEYPNKKGERPEVMNDFVHAQRLCAAQSKRVCTETEWTMACAGPSYKPYPYGYVRDPNKCRGDREYRFPNVKATVSKDKAKAHKELERLWDGVVSGSQPECVSDYGVHDMPGITPVAKLCG